MTPDPHIPPNLSPRELLEIQITARLLGELSAPECASLDEAILHDPELAQFETRLRRTLPWIETACRHPTPETQIAITPSSSASPSPDPQPTAVATDLSVTAESRRSAFLNRLRHESPTPLVSLPSSKPPSAPLPLPPPTAPGILSFPSLRWLALAAGLVALFFVISTSLHLRRETPAAFDLALELPPSATSLDSPYTVTNRVLLRRRGSDFGDFGSVVTTPAETQTPSRGRSLASSEDLSFGRAVQVEGRFYDNEEVPATSAPESPLQLQDKDTHWNFSANRPGLAGEARRERLAETVSPTLSRDNKSLDLPSAGGATPAEPSITSIDFDGDHHIGLGLIAQPPGPAPTTLTRGSEVRLQGGQPLRPDLSTRYSLDAPISRLTTEAESLERGATRTITPPSASPEPADSLDAFAYQPLALGDPVQLGKRLEKDGVQERLSIASTADREGSRGELPELRQQVQTTPPPPTVLFPPETLTSDQPLSTFSLNVADVSFQLAAASLAQGQLPPPHSIRTEEFINAFHYRDPEPAPGAPVGFSWERSRFPFAQQRDVLRLAVRTAAIGRDARQPLQLVLVIDASGSMERPDRLATLHAALQALATQLGLSDRLSAVTFARTARLVIDNGLGSDAPRLVERLRQTVPEGGTHLEEALRLGYQTALRHFIPGGVNRVILFTDGAANLGELQNSELQSIVESHRRRGIALDTFGIGWDGYDDERLAALARHGDGRYGFLNAPDDVASRFVRQLTGALEVAASDVKVQVEFHPDRVASWRQVGYAQHQLTAEQFRDDTVDAAELGAAESGNALYLIETLPQGSGPIATVRVRFRQPSTGVITEHSWAIPYNGLASDLAEASPALRLAVAAAGLGERLAGNPLAAGISIPDLQTLLQDVVEFYHPDPAPARLLHMLQQAAPLLAP